MSAGFSVLGGATADRYCRVLRKPRGIPAPMRLRRGESMGALFPTGIEVPMAPEYRGFDVPDVIYSVVGCPIVSGRFRSFLEQQALGPIEFHQITLVNHKGRPVDTEVYFANLLTHVACVDSGATEGLVDPVEPDEFMQLDRLVIDMQRVPDQVRLFRLKEKRDCVVVRDDLRTAMEAKTFALEFRDCARLSV